MANILVIDDDKDILRLLEFTLKRAGHNVFTGLDGVQGMEQAEANHPDLIIVDVMMPRMNGYEFCRLARSKPAFKDTPIIIYSAHVQHKDKKSAAEVGADDFLSKTTPPDKLIKRIDDLLINHEQ